MTVWRIFSLTAGCLRFVYFSVNDIFTGNGLNFFVINEVYRNVFQWKNNIKDKTKSIYVYTDNMKQMVVKNINMFVRMTLFIPFYPIILQTKVMK